MTNYVKQKFQWFFDMSTNTTACQRIDIAAGGNDIYDRLAPFFGAFKHFKLGAVKIRMVPAATLPVDPTGLSYEAGETTVDPRDMFNPGLVRITNGEDLPPSTSVTENNYYATMLDKRWYKFRLQSGFRRTATPLFWGVGQTHQDIFPGSAINVPFMQSGEDKIGSIEEHGSNNGFTPTTASKNMSSPYALYQTGEKIRMGWLPTDAFELNPHNNTYQTVTKGANPIPQVPIITVILPKAYKTKFYYRVFVEETVMFKDAVAVNPYVDTDNYYYHQPVDRALVNENMAIQMGAAVTDYPNFVAGKGFRGGA